MHKSNQPVRSGPVRQPGGRDGTLYCVCDVINRGPSVVDNCIRGWGEGIFVVVVNDFVVVIVIVVDSILGKWGL